MRTWNFRFWFGENSRLRDWDCQRLQGTSLTYWECPHRCPKPTGTVYPPRLIWRGDRTSHSRRNILRYFVSSIHKERKSLMQQNSRPGPFPARRGTLWHTIHWSRYGSIQRLWGNLWSSHSLRDWIPLRWQQSGTVGLSEDSRLCGTSGTLCGTPGSLRRLRDCLTTSGQEVV